MSSDEENMFEIAKKMITIEKLLRKKKVSFDEDLEQDLNSLLKDLKDIACKIKDSDEYLTEEIETLKKESDRDDIYSELQDILAPYYDELVDLTDTIDKQADTTINLRKRLETFKENVSLLFENLLDIEKRITNLQE
jgi:predicted nuclease with TOPRIM domain